MSATKQAEQAEAIVFLRKRVRPGAVVFLYITHAARSGMSRRIRTFIIRNGVPCDIGPWVARALGYRRNRDDGGIVVGGAGMDMGFHLVDGLSHALFGKGGVITREWF